MDDETTEDFDELTDRAFAQLEAVGGDRSRLPEPVAHFITVFSAQGALDNGGYRYFFESDWPGQPDYETFCRAYEAIGCREQAAELRRVVDSFGFERPHLRVDLRNAYLGEHYDEEHHCVPHWGDALCGDAAVWSALAAYAARHRTAF